MQAHIKLLEQRLEKVEREGKRKTAPFRKKCKADPKIAMCKNSAPTKSGSGCIGLPRHITTVDR